MGFNERDGTELRRRWALLAVAVAVLSTGSAAQIRVGPQRLRETGVVALHQAVRDAASDTLVLLLASHPDDRYMLPATFLRVQRGYRVAVLLFTRGRGGQNSLGPQTGDALGRLRTLEAERSSQHFGAKVYYLNRLDDGFSRSAEETLRQWGEKGTVQALARMLRIIKPDVILTTHNPEEKHGHDLALLQVLPQAVALAGSSSAIHGLPPFEISRVFRTATADESEEICVSLPMDRMDEDRGKTSRELAYAALKEHQSQRPFQLMTELFRTIMDLVYIGGDEDLRPDTLTEGLPDVFGELVGRIPPAEIVALRAAFRALPKALQSRRELARQAIALLRKLNAIEPKPGSALERRLARRVEALQRIVLQSAGVHVFIEDPQREAAPHDDLPLDLWVRNEGDHRVTGIEVDAVGGGTLKLTSPTRQQTAVEPHASLALNAVYCPPDLSEPDLQRLFSTDTYEPPLRVRFKLAIDGQPLTIEQPIETRLQPGLKLTVAPRTLLLPRDVDTVRFVVEVERKTSKPITDLKLQVKPPVKMLVDTNVRLVNFAAKERYREFMFTLNAPNLNPGVSTMVIRAGPYRERVRVHKVDVAVRKGLKVGFLPGFDTATYEVLQALIGHSRLEKFEKNQPIPILDRSRFDTIVVDIRALREQPAFKRGFARVLEFVKQGGRLVVFYHKDQEFNLDEAGFQGAPYPLRIGKGRVTREDVLPKLLVPDHVLFHYPNTIRSEDWDGWKQERGLYFPEEYDRERYQELLEMHDDGQPPERGALLYARYGKGDYIYCALSLYRQLKNRHAGACRLFANLISPRPERAR